nr:MAG TPA: hypothetical protein [Caudoviricetes sp.]
MFPFPYLLINFHVIITLQAHLLSNIGGNYL